jgi:hypothetical protein
MHLVNLIAIVEKLVRSGGVAPVRTGIGNSKTRRDAIRRKLPTGFKQICVLMFLSLVMLAFGALPSSAGVISTPTGLNPGASFRIAFVTSGLTTATATDINYYNTFVSAEAASYTYAGQAITWKAIASTESIDARDNIGGVGANIPVYLVDGTKIANDLTENTGGLWSGALLSFLNKQIDGSSPTTSTVFEERVWTGTWQNGQGFVPQLGTAGPRYGRFDKSDNGWITFQAQGKNEISRLYGISETLTVASGSEVPEPTSMTIFGLGALGFAYRNRRKWIAATTRR